jgi:hypothetical protein
MGLLRCFEGEEIPRNEVRRGGQTGIFSSACNKTHTKSIFLYKLKGLVNSYFCETVTLL